MESLEQNTSIEFVVHGRTALFSDPITRMGGEKCSYQIPTYQALKGITESIYWKPTLVWKIDAVRVLNPITSQSKGIRPLLYAKGGNTLSIYTYLADVAYQVKAHFVWNLNRPELADDRNTKKHLCIARRMVERGGRRDVFLGTRECQAYVEPCTFGEGDGAYDTLEEMPFGLMFHGFSYPSETGETYLKARFWYPKMQKGIVTFCDPDDCPVIRPIKPLGSKIFTLGENMTSCDEFMQEEGLEAGLA